MATSSMPKDRMTSRMALVERHVRLENAHDLEGVLHTFGTGVHYDDESMGRTS
jgi:hypothetical protein